MSARAMKRDALRDVVLKVGMAAAMLRMGGSFGAGVLALRAALVGLAMVSSAMINPGAMAQTVAITNGKVVIGGEAEILDNATLVFQGERITAVGTGIVPPADARVIDAAGKWVTTGIFAPASQVGLVEIEAESATDDSDGASEYFSTALTIADGFNPNASTIAATRIEGVTRAALTPSAGDVMFSGQGALVDHSGAGDSVLDPSAFMLVRFGAGGARQAGGSRAASWAYFRAALTDARGFPGRFFSHKEGDALDRADAGAFAPYARGLKPIVIEANRASDLRQVIALGADQPVLQLIILGGAEAHLVADGLADADIPVILDPLNALPASFDQVGARHDAAKILVDAGVTIAFYPDTSGLTHQVRLLPQHAGVAVAHGLGWAEAFNAITLNPAKIFGVGRDYGSLEIGKVADVVVWDGDPLEVMSAPDMVFIAGVEMPMVSRQTKLRDRYLALPDGGWTLPLAYTRP